ncbi:MAG TPA: dephospho-CoA kinase [Parvularculaceae bacterium]|nr:dephospho-CoA kinase [Parvularculaceae bacterium]
MIIVGLTGSIGMGKSTVLEMFREAGAAVWNADEAVHRLYAKGGAGVFPVGKEFPEAVADGAVDREKLSRLVIDSSARMRKLEAIVHPLVAADREAFVKRARAAKASLAVLDIPLLFESGADSRVDTVVVVSAPAEVQRTRVLARPGMTEEKFNKIRAMQTRDADKCRRADYVIDTGQDLAATRAEVDAVIAELKRNPPRRR